MRFVSTEALDSILIIYVHMPQCVHVGLYFYGLNFFFFSKFTSVGCPLIVGLADLDTVVTTQRSVGSWMEQV